MRRELKWLPGSCAYCNGVGKVGAEMEKNVAVDATYLSFDLSTEERIKFIKGDPGAMERAYQHEMEADHLIRQICYLHFEGGLNARQIEDFFFLANVEEDTEHRKLFGEYVKRVIEVKSGDKN
jgi:hypothetical protein